MGREKKEERGEGVGSFFPSLSLPPATNFMSPLSPSPLRDSRLPKRKRKRLLRRLETWKNVCGIRRFMEEKNANLDFNILDASNKRCSSVAVIVIICSYIIEKDTAFFIAATSHSKLIANKLNLMYEL